MHKTNYLFLKPGASFVTTHIPPTTRRLRARRIIGGMTYNTATSTLLATAHHESNGNSWDPEWDAGIFRTRGGAYFEVTHTIHSWHDSRESEWKTKSTTDIVPLVDHAAAVKWVEDLEADIVEDFFDLPDDAGPLSPTASFPLRMSDIVKRRLATKAKEAGLSMNAYAVQCLERCLTEPPQAGLHMMLKNPL